MNQKKRKEKILIKMNKKKRKKTIKKEDSNKN